MIYAPISAVGVLMVFSASYFSADGLLVCVPMDKHRDFINDTRFDYYKEDYSIITVNPIITFQGCSLGRGMILSGCL